MTPPVNTTTRIASRTHQHLATKLLLVGGVIGPLAFIVTFLIEGATRPGYSAWHNFVSDLSTSPQGWVQIVSFIVCGLLTLGFAFGLHQVMPAGKGAVWGPRILGLFGVSLVIAGVFVTDPSLGYFPPGTAMNLVTWHGTIHSMNAPLAFGSITLAIFLLARRFTSEPTTRGWAIYSWVTGILCAVTFIACIIVSQLDESGVLANSPTGVLERIAIIASWGWVSLLAFRLLWSTKA